MKICTYTGNCPPGKPHCCSECAEDACKYRCASDPGDCGYAEERTIVKVGMHVDGGETFEEYLEYEHDPTDEEIKFDAKEWAWNYIDLWWEREPHDK